MIKVSIIMGVFNDEMHIMDSINSIIDQDFKNWEFIICDDASTDGSYEKIKNISNIDSRIVCLRNEKNMNLAFTLNRCIEKSKGEYIARMDSDDISIKNRLTRQVEFLEKNHKYSIVGTKAKVFDGEKVYETRGCSGEIEKIDIFNHKSFIHPTIMMRKDDLIKVGKYSISDITRRTEDYDLYCKFYKQGYIGYNLDEILYMYRESGQNLKKRKYKFRIDEYKLRRKWYKELNIEYRYKYLIYRPLISGLIPEKIKRLARELLSKVSPL